MSDDIKIKVGVQSSVKAGMDGVVRDINYSSKSMQGKGFMEAFQKAIRGDISGALEDMQQRMGSGMKSVNAKAMIWGGGIATAVFAGFKAGQQLDAMFGISDKIAAAWNKAAVEAGKSWDAFYKSLRAKRQDNEDDIKTTMETNAAIFDMREKQKLAGMTGKEKVSYLEQAVPSMERNAKDESISHEERKKRLIELEKLRQEIDSAKKQAANEEYTSNLDKYQAEREQAEFMADMDEEEAKRKKELVEEDKQNAKETAELVKSLTEQQLEIDRKAYDARRNQLSKLAELEGLGKALGDTAMNPEAFAKQNQKVKDDQREADRKQARIDQAKANQERGTKLSNRDLALLDAEKLREAGAREAKKLRDLDKAWKLKQEQAANAMINIEKQLANIAKG